VILVLLPARAQACRAGMAMVVMAHGVESTAHEALSLLEVRGHAQPLTTPLTRAIMGSISQGRRSLHSL
jgi:hypothetical protein